MIEAEDLAMLTGSFAAALAAAGTATSAEAALYELGWADLLSVAPAQGAAATFSVLGATGSAATLLDDVLAESLGVPVDLGTCVVLPGPHQSAPPGQLSGDSVRAAGLVSSRIAAASRVVLPVATGDDVVLFDVASLARASGTERHALDAASPFVRVAPFTLQAGEAVEVGGVGAVDWSRAVAAARVALSQQLIATCRVMLAEARQHALDREQFGRSVGSFQVVRHKLVDSLVAIEAAAAVADLAVVTGDPLTAAVAKSLAGRAARTTSTHAQQVLAGIGFTTDHDFHLSLKRTMVLDTLFGSAKTLPAEIGRRLREAGQAPRLTDLQSESNLR